MIGRGAIHRRRAFGLALVQALLVALGLVHLHLGDGASAPAAAGTRLESPCASGCQDPLHHHRRDDDGACPGCRSLEARATGASGPAVAASERHGLLPLARGGARRAASSAAAEPRGPPASA